jgi:thiol-disulfide isomerase/thioredoxin
MTDIDGNEVALSDYFGKPVVLNFWATWCTYCVQEMPDLYEAYGKYKEDAQFMLLNCTDDTETREVAAAYMEENGYDFPLFFDELNAQGQRAYAVAGIPDTVFITSDGGLFAYHRGYLSGAEFEGYMSALLEYEAANE